MKRSARASKPEAGIQLRIFDVIWHEKFVAKIAEKHGIMTEEVEDVLFSAPHVRLVEKGRIKSEHLYVAYGRTGAGRYLVVFFIRKRGSAALPITAREMTRAERRYFDAQK
jgi:uncharacterized DUF497 family protein